MKTFSKIFILFSVLIITVYSTYGIYDPNKEYTETNPDEFTILSVPEVSTIADEGQGVDNMETASEDISQPVEYKAKVTKKMSVYTSEMDGIKYQKLKVKILDDGQYKDQELEAEYILQILDSSESKELEVGSTVYVMYDTSSITPKLVVKDVDRMPYLVIVVLIFLVTLLIIGGKQGLKTILSLGITLLAIFYILVPAIINGYSAILMSIIVCALISIISLTLVGGFNKKSMVSIIGTISGVIIAGILAVVISNLGRITGLSNEDAQMLIYLSRDTYIDVYGMFFASIIIGVVGATMDITMSIASSMNELVKTSKNISRSELIKSGLNVGKDSIGTMSNTLILAYVGESLILIILFMLNNSNWVSIVNSDFIASEILRSLCGIIGMISAIPITTFLYGMLANTNKE